MHTPHGEAGLLFGAACCGTEEAGCQLPLATTLQYEETLCCGFSALKKNFLTEYPVNMIAINEKLGFSMWILIL